MILYKNDSDSWYGAAVMDEEAWVSQAGCTVTDLNDE